MFKLSGVTLGDDYTEFQLLEQLAHNVVYTYGDGLQNLGAAIIQGVDDGEGGYALPPNVRVYIGPAYQCGAVGVIGTYLVTNYHNNKLAFVPLHADERAFCTAHPEVLADLAEILGYSAGYEVWQFFEGDNTYKFSYCWQNASMVTPNTYDAGFGTHVGSGGNSAHGLFAQDDLSLTMFDAYIADGAWFRKTLPNAIMKWDDVVNIPQSMFMTDLENVQDICRSYIAALSVKLSSETAAIVSQHSADVQGLITANGALANAVFSANVFGTKFSDVVDAAERINAVSQYIPRP